MQKKSRKGIGGPKTQAGKDRSKMNAAKHGATASVESVITLNQNDPAFRELKDGFFAEMNPTTAIETHLVSQMVVAAWKQRIGSEAEAALMSVSISRIQSDAALEFDNPAQSVLLALGFAHAADTSKALPLLIRYQAEARRAFERAMKSFRELRQDHPNSGFNATWTESLAAQPAKKPVIPIRSNFDSTAYTQNRGKNETNSARRAQTPQPSRPTPSQPPTSRRNDVNDAA